ncbi:inner membrane protein YjjP [Ruminiclostridium hungatei]|uniref:Inner membrane protein YjjP n=1 Tax=Ruminiclostridium hungatei TaxID=48256 RepID=A0A1V4SLW7_RUMHU|nr:threonine/serine exporter family protein [Ruminiclostridium hungatei]OPX44496.1 inner membrane protein YjjP [Ruminiclostridium hungatei]
MEAKKVAEIATAAGEILLSNGAEAYRVEETIKKICSSYGFSGECISTSTGIYISISDSQGELVTTVKRINQRRVDLYRVELINSFSRGLAQSPLTYEEARRKLDEIYNAPNFSLGIRLLASGFTAFAYTLFFNGGIYDAVVSLVISFGIYLLLEYISKIGSFQFLEYYLSGFIIGAVSLVAASLLPVINKDNVITGAIIVLLPGVALTNGIKDLLYGDYVSGFAKFGEAILIIVAMGVGIVTALSIIRI